MSEEITPNGNPNGNSNVTEIGKGQEIKAKKRITKGDMLAKADEVEDTYIESVDAWLPVRRLKDGQFSKIEQCSAAGVEMVGEPEFDDEGNPKPGTGMKQHVDVQKTIEGEAKGRRLALVFCIADGDTWTESEIAEMPSGFVRQTAEAIYKLSGVTKDAEELKRFRKESGGEGDSDTPEDGVSAGSEPAGPDAPTE